MPPPVELVDDFRLTALSLLARNLAGPDPYDALGTGHQPPRTPLQKYWRQARVQAVKRSPVNLRPLLGIQPLRMTKTIAQVVIAGVRAGHLVPELANAVERLVTELQERAQTVDEMTWWGYEFDTQMRWSFNAAGEPNLIVTRFACDALLEADRVGIHVDEAVLAGVGALLLRLREEDQNGSFFRYVLSAEVAIHNASALGAGLAVRLGERLGSREISSAGTEVAESLLIRLEPDGAWPYGASESLPWKDTFHSAYTLIGLLEAGLRAPLAEEALRERGITQDGRIRYYLDQPKVGDAHTLGTLLWWLRDDDAMVAKIWQMNRQTLSWHDETGLRWGNGYPRWDESHVLRGLAEVLAAG